MIESFSGAIGTNIGLAQPGDISTGWSGTIGTTYLFFATRIEGLAGRFTIDNCRVADYPIGEDILQALENAGLQPSPPIDGDDLLSPPFFDRVALTTTPPPCTVDTTLRTLQSIRVRFNADVSDLTVEDFRVCEDDWYEPMPPNIDSLRVVDEHEVEITLSRPIRAGAWTGILYVGGTFSSWFGAQPGDINGDHGITLADAIGLFSCLRHGLCGDLPRDIDSSGFCDLLDLMLEIDILNGADDLEPPYRPLPPQKDCRPQN